MKFEITGYDGLNKVAMTKAFREYSGKGLADSKQMTDDLLKNGCQEFDISDRSDSVKLLKCLRDANAHVSVTDN